MGGPTRLGVKPHSIALILVCENEGNYDSSEKPRCEHYNIFPASQHFSTLIA